MARKTAPGAPLHDPGPEAADPPVLVEFLVPPDALDARPLELIQRMAAAMGLSEADYRVVPEASDGARARVDMREGAMDPSGEAAFSVTSPSPVRILSEPALKKPLWKDLQKLMVRLGRPVKGGPR